MTIYYTDLQNTLSHALYLIKVFAVTGQDNAWQLKSKFFLTVSYSVNIIGFKQFHKKSINDKIQ